MTDTSIQWTDKTWNPVRGCSLVSPGCTNCYAMRVAHRFRGPYEGLTKSTSHGPVWTGRARMVPEMLDLPLKWKKPQRVFVNSMSDLFHEDVPDEFIDGVFAVMSVAHHHTFQILTKRAERMRDYCGNATTAGRVLELLTKLVDGHGSVEVNHTPDGMQGIALPNVWLGVSVEDQQRADERIPLLLQTPAAVRFLSCEPLLGPVSIERWMWPVHWHWDARYKSPEAAIAAGAFAEKKRQALLGAHVPLVKWVIVGGESGPGARPFDVEWGRALVAQCKPAGVPAFVKQLGTDPVWDGHSNAEKPNWPAGTVKDDGRGDGHWHVKLRDRAGGDPSEWPEDLRVREWPKQ